MKNTVAVCYTSKPYMEEFLRGKEGVLAEDALEEYDRDTTLQALVRALETCGYRPRLLSWGSELAESWASLGDFDAFFNIAEGYGGRAREAQVPAFLEMMGRGADVVGSDAQTLTVALDKALCQSVLHSERIRVPKGFVATTAEEGKLQSLRNLRTDGYPLIVKPTREGSSRGVGKTSLVYDDAQLVTEVRRILTEYGQPAIVERFCPGAEITVGLVGCPLRVWGVMQIIPVKHDPSWIYGIEAKRAWETEVTYQLLEPGSGHYEVCAETALKAAQVLGCRDFARIDLRYGFHYPHVIDVNPLPGLDPVSSDLCIMTRLMDRTYPELLQAILEGACGRGILERDAT